VKNRLARIQSLAVAKGWAPMDLSKLVPHVVASDAGLSPNVAARVRYS
jgi:hypothetical protein